MMTLFLATVMRMNPMTCTKPDGTTYQMDNPLSGIPFVGGTPDNCTDGPSIAGQVVDSIWGPGSWQQAVGDTVKSSATFWLNQPSPTVVDPNTHVLTGAAANINNSLIWVTMLLFTCVIAIKGAQIAWAGARGGEPLAELVRGVFDFILAAGVVAGIVGVVLVATDQMATWLVDQSAQGGFAENLNAYLANPELISGMSTIFAYGLLGLAFLFALLQELLFAGRGGVLVVLLGVYLLSSTTTSLKQGRASHQTLTAWIIGFTLYKIAAAVVYAGAFWLIGTPTGTTNAGWTILEGVALMGMSIFALYAVIRMAMPATAPVVGNGFGQSVTSAAFLVAR